MRSCPNITLSRKNRAMGSEGQGKEDEIIQEKIQLQLIVIDYNTISFAGREKSPSSVLP